MELGNRPVWWTGKSGESRARESEGLAAGEKLA